MLAGDAEQVALMVEVVVKQLHIHLHRMMGETVANEPGDLMVIGTWTLTVLVLTETELWNVIEVLGEMMLLIQTRSVGTEMEF
jgi:hypothetical protein